MNRKEFTLIAALAVLLVTAMAVANASIFAYKGLSGSVKVTDVTSGQNENTIINYGPACAGFYVKGAGSSDTIGDSELLPDAGTNYNGATWSPGSGWYGAKVSLGEKACEWTNSTSSKTDALYKSVTINVNVTTGTWFFKDLIGFGYPKKFNPSQVFVSLVANKTLSDSNIVSAFLVVKNAADGTTVMKINLKNGNIVSGSNPITLNAGDGLRIDLWLTSSGSVSSDSFTIGFYVSPSSETP